MVNHSPIRSTSLAQLESSLHNPVTQFNCTALNLHAGVIVSRWAPQSSKLVAGCAEQAAVGSTPIHSRLRLEIREWRLGNL
jgi:hypothetical protein